MQKFLIIALAVLSYRLQAVAPSLPEQPEDIYDLFDLDDDELDVKIEKKLVDEVQAQHPFFEEHGIDPVAVLNDTLYTEPFLEFGNPSRHSTLLDEELQVKSIKADNYCFVKFLGANKFEKTFFFRCEDKFTRSRNEEIFFRELNENCPYPDALPPQQPEVKECTYYAKKTHDTIAGAIEAVGSDHTEIVARCLLTCIATEVTSITVKCAEEALGQEWQKITQQDLMEFQTHEDLEKEDVNDDGSITYVNKRQKVLAPKTNTV